MMERVIFLVGPTAVGKSEVAACLSRKINAEIISCDSMQVYKGMDIITSKASHSGAMKKAKHHLIDIVSPETEYNVSKYRKEALKKINEVLKRGKTPIFVGGTGLYVSIMVDGLFSQKAKSKAIRDKLYKHAQKYGNPYLYDRLKRIDPEAASKINPHDLRRIVRALEVFEATGRPISVLQKQREGLAKNYDIKIFCLNMERQKLYDRINARVDKMFKLGLVREVKRLLKLKLSKTASFAIGLRELKGYLDGLYGLEEARKLMKRNTRLYAKRQLTWFRKDKRIVWIELDKQGSPAVAARRILKYI